jgi:putative sugar O-methyltransferase
MERDIIKAIEENLKLQFEESRKANQPGELESKWDFLTSSEPQRFINPDITLKIDILKNFRKLDIFITDSPPNTLLPLRLNPLNYVHGGRRGTIKYLKELYSLLKESSNFDLLERHPVSPVGNPNLFKHKGYIYTARWVRHILFLGLFKRVLEGKIANDFICLDIGSSYGIFSGLLRREYPLSRHILLDFPEQLVLAHYFLGCNFPEARIAGYKEISDMEYIDREFISKYDFTLLPWFLYKRLCHNSIDIVSNFASLGEMRREWVDYYLKSEPFLSTKYFFTANRFQSYPEYDTDLTILDYPLLDFKKLHFRISPYFSHVYKRKYLFWHERYNFSSQYFEFIGER